MLRAIADFVIVTFGITPPRPGQERLATAFIVTLLCLIVLVLAGGGYFFAKVMF